MQPDHPPTLASARRIVQIIVGALSMGIISFGVVAVMQGLDLENRDAGFLTLGAGVVTLGAILVNLFGLPLLVSGNLRQIARPGGQTSPGPVEASGDEAQLLGVYQTKTVVGAASYEGAAFLSLLAFMLEGHLASLACAGICLLGVWTHLPWGSRIEDFVSEQTRGLEEQRHLHP